MKFRILFIFFGFVSAVAFAQTADIPGSSDYAAFGRYSGFVISAWRKTDFTEAGKKAGIKYQINYALADAKAMPPDVKLVVKMHTDQVKKHGGKVISNDGNTATMELKYNQQNLFVQVGAYGATYELIVVEKNAAGTATSVELTAHGSMEGREITGQKYALFDPFAGFFVASFLESDFTVQGNKQGEKYFARFSMNDKSAKVPDSKEIVKKYTAFSEAQGGKTLISSPTGATIEYNKNSRHIWAQVKVTGNMYEITAIEKDIPDEEPAVAQEPEKENKIVEVKKEDTKTTIVAQVAKDTVKKADPAKQTAQKETTQKAVAQQVAKDTIKKQNAQVIAQSKASYFNQETGKDYPLFGRISGYTIVGYEEKGLITGGGYKGYKYQINYRLADPAQPIAGDRNIVQHHLNIVKQKGGKILTDDGNLVTMEIKNQGENLFVQVGAYGTSYELVVVDRSPAALARAKQNPNQDFDRNAAYANNTGQGRYATGTQGGYATGAANASGNYSGNYAGNQYNAAGTVQNGSLRTQSSTSYFGSAGTARDYPMFARLPGYSIIGYEERGMTTGGGYKGYKYQINYGIDNPANIPSEVSIAQHYANIAKAEGAKILTDDGNLVTMEIKDASRNLFIQIGSYGATYEIVVVDRSPAGMAKATANPGGISEANGATAYGGNTYSGSNTDYSSQPLYTDAGSDPGFVSGSMSSAGSVQMSELRMNGKIVLKNISFEGEKPAYTQDLAAIAELLKSNPQSKFCLVSHVAGSGDISADISLSEKRAEALLDKLIDEYGIAASRLKAKGIGSLAPLSSNQTAEGRKVNERIEVIEIR